MSENDKPEKLENNVDKWKWFRSSHSFGDYVHAFLSHWKTIPSLLFIYGIFDRAIDIVDKIGNIDTLFHPPQWLDNPLISLACIGIALLWFWYAVRKETEANSVSSIAQDNATASNPIPVFQSVLMLTAFGVLAAIIVWGALYLFRDKTSKAPSQIVSITPSPPATSSSSPFGVEVRTALVAEAGTFTSYMVTYPSMFGQTASPLFYLAYARISNFQDIACTVREFKVSVSETRDGAWEDLVPIPLAGVKLYFLLEKSENVSPKIITFGNGGKFNLLGFTSPERLKFAAQMRAFPLLETDLISPIPAHQTISGWIAFDSKIHKGLTSSQIYLRITIRDTANRGDSYIVPLGNPDDSSLDINVGEMKALGPVLDISNFKIKYYSDPYPPLPSR